MFGFTNNNIPLELSCINYYYRILKKSKVAGSWACWLSTSGGGVEGKRLNSGVVIQQPFRMYCRISS
jgi:hypothetical protein